MDKNGQNGHFRTKMDKIDILGQKWTKWTFWDKSGQKYPF
jgi:hypothetical protein